MSTSIDNFKDYRFLFYKRINKKSAPLKFLVAYYLKGKYPDTVFSQFIANNPQSTWQQILKHSDESERKSLLCAWLRYAKYPLIKDAQVWINNNYGFVEKNAEELTESIIEKICEDTKFEELNLGSQLVLGKVIDTNSYAINIHNLSVVIAHLTQTVVDENKIILSEIMSTQNSNFIEYIQSNIKDAFETFSTSNKNENEEALQWLINNDKLDDAQLDKYLNGQNNSIQSLYDVPQERWKLVLKNYILQPSWESLQRYYTFTGEFDDVILCYIEKYSEQLGEQSFGSDGNAESVFFGGIFKSKDISLNSIKLLTPVFIENSYDGDEELSDLDAERLEWLLDHEMLLFSEGNSTVLKETEIFSKYLVKYKEDFLQSISESYLTNPKVIINLMKNDQFSGSEHYLIVGNIPHSILFGNRQVADIVVTHLAKYGETDKEVSFYSSLLGVSSTNESAVRLATKVILKENVEMSDCNQILVSLGDTYADLTDNSKNPKFDATPFNMQVLEAAKRRGIITSYKQYKDNQLRAYHGRK